MNRSTTNNATQMARLVATNAELVQEITSKAGENLEAGLSRRDEQSEK